MGGLLRAVPQAVRTSFVLWMTAVGIGLISLIVTLVSTTGPGRGSVGVGGVGLVLLALFARKMLEGANWARITLTVLAVLGLVLGVGGFVLLSGAGAEVPAVSLVFSIAQWLVMAAAIWFAFQPPANEYFRSVVRAR